MKNMSPRADFRGDLVATAAKTANSYYSGTAGSILDPKVALERQFGGLSLRCQRFFDPAPNKRTTRRLRRKIRFREKTGFDFATL